MPRPSSETSPLQPAQQPVGLTMEAGGRPLDEILSVVAAASRARTRVRLTDVRARPIEDLMRIAVTGGDCVVFGKDVAAARDVAPPRRSWFFR